jgi:hypothetical protein
MGAKRCATLVISDSKSAKVENKTFAPGDPGLAGSLGKEIPCLMADAKTPAATVRGWLDALRLAGHSSVRLLVDRGWLPVELVGPEVLQNPYGANLLVAVDNSAVTISGTGGSWKPMPHDQGVPDPQLLTDLRRIYGYQPIEGASRLVFAVYGEASYQHLVGAMDIAMSPVESGKLPLPGVAWLTTHSPDPAKRPRPPPRPEDLMPASKEPDVKALRAKFATDIELMEKRVVTQVETKPFFILKPSGPRLLRCGEGLIVRTVTPEPPRLLLAGKKKKSRRLSSAMLLDLDSGKVLARTGAPKRCHTKDLLHLVKTRKGAPALLDLKDGRLLTPRALLPDGAKAKKPQIFALDCSEDVWVFAEASDKGSRYGLWEDPRADPEVRLDQRLPNMPNAWVCSPEKDAIEVVHKVWIGPHGDPPPKGCVRYRLRKGREAECRQKKPSSLDPVFLEGDWVVSRDNIMHISSGQKAPLPLECGGSIFSIHLAKASPPRVLAACPHAKYTDIVLWSPEKSWVWRELDGRWTEKFMWTDQIQDPVYALNTVDKPARIWLDMEKGILVKTESLFPLTSLSTGREILVYRQHDGGDKDLLLLDLEKYELRHIADITDCKKGRLMKQHRLGDRVAISCDIQPDPNREVFRLKWHELIDLSSRKRWRFHWAVEAILDTTRIIVSDRQWAAAESYTTGRRIYMLTLKNEFDQ